MKRHTRRWQSYAIHSDRRSPFQSVTLKQLIRFETSTWWLSLKRRGLFKRWSEQNRSCLKSKNVHPVYIQRTYELKNDTIRTTRSQYHAIRQATCLDVTWLSWKSGRWLTTAIYNVGLGFTSRSNIAGRLARATWRRQRDKWASNWLVACVQRLDFVSSSSSSLSFAAPDTCLSVCSVFRLQQNSQRRSERV